MCLLQDHPSESTSKLPYEAIVLYDFEPAGPEEIPITVGEVVEVLSDKTAEGWVLVRTKEGTVGDVPFSYIERRENSPAPSEKPKEFVMSEKDEKQRLYVIREIVASEENYLADLTILVDDIMVPMQSKGLLTSAEASTIFSSISSLKDTSAQLVALCKGAEGSPEPGAVIAKAFSELADYFKMYSFYCSNQLQSLDTLAKVTQSNKAVASFLDENTKKLNGLNLESYLIKPIQRLCKYPLLFRELLKNTPTQHPEFEALSAANTQICKIADLVNEKKRQSENMYRMSALQQTILNYPNMDSLITPSRRFILEGDCTIHDKKTSHLHFFLFSDLLIFAKPKGSTFSKSGPRKFVFKREVEDLASLLVQLEPEAGFKGDQAFCFGVVESSSRKKYTMELATVEEKDMIFNAMRDVSQALRKIIEEKPKQEKIRAWKRHATMPKSGMAAAKAAREKGDREAAAQANLDAIHALYHNPYAKPQAPEEPTKGPEKKERAFKKHKSLPRGAWKGGLGSAESLEALKAMYPDSPDKGTSPGKPVEGEAAAPNINEMDRDELEAFCHKILAENAALKKEVASLKGSK